MNLFHLLSVQVLASVLGDAMWHDCLRGSWGVWPRARVP